MGRRRQSSNSNNNNNNNNNNNRKATQGGFEPPQSVLVKHVRPWRANSCSQRQRLIQVATRPLPHRVVFWQWLAAVAQGSLVCRSDRSRGLQQWERLYICYVYKSVGKYSNHLNINFLFIDPYSIAGNSPEVSPSCRRWKFARQTMQEENLLEMAVSPTRWAPTSPKWSYNSYK